MTWMSATNLERKFQLLRPFHDCTWRTLMIHTSLLMPKFKRRWPICLSQIRRNVETNPCGTNGNCKVQEPSKGINFLTKHARSDRISGLTVQPAYSSHIQCAKRAHHITRIPGIPMACCGSKPISDWRLSPSPKVGLPQQMFWVGKKIQHCPAVISRMKAIFARFGISKRWCQITVPRLLDQNFHLFLRCGNSTMLLQVLLTPGNQAGRKVCSNSKTHAQEGQDCVPSFIPQSFRI